MALSLRRGTWSQVCRGRPNLASKLYLTILSPVVFHSHILASSPNLHGISTDTLKFTTLFLGTNKKVNLTGLSVYSPRSSGSSGVNNNISIGGKGESVQATGFIRKNQCETGLLFGLHISFSKFNTTFNPIRSFRTWEPSTKVLHAKKSRGEMSNLKVDPAAPDSIKKSPSSGSDSPDSMGSAASARSSPQGIREDVAPNEREPMWKIKKEKNLKESIEERKARCNFRKCTLLKSIDTWPEYYSRKEREIKDDRKGTKGSLKSPCVQLNNKVSIWKGDITSLVIDAIVNAANESLMGGGGVDGAIHSASGKFLKQECMTLRPCLTGQAVITGGYDLPAKYVIHTVGPRGEDPDKLRSCYENSLKYLLENKLKSIAFPCVSTGIYGYPNDKAAEVVLKTVRDWLEKNNEKVERVIFCLFLEKDIRIYEEKMQLYFPIPSNETGKAGQDEPKVKPQKEM